MADVPANRPAVAKTAPITVCACFFMVRILFFDIEQQNATS
jgi:hypothetical protein